MNVPALLFFVVSTFGARLAWRRGAHFLAVAAAAMAMLFGLSLWRSTHPLLLVALVAVAVGVVAHRSGATAATVTRWGARIRRKSGVASGVDVARHASAVAMRRRAPTMRPSLRVESQRERCRQLAALPATEVSVRLCRVGGQTAWAAHEEFVTIFGGPRKGKTLLLAGQVIDHPGAVIATSTRTDLLDLTSPLRAERGPVYVFNPVGLGDRESTVTFEPLTGCADPVTAAERATDMLAASGTYGGRSGDREFWDDQGRRNLAALLHAAALAETLTVHDVQDWLADLDGSAAQITGLLRNKSPEPAFEASVTQFIETNERTRSSITSTIAPALAWLTHKPAREAALPARHGGHPLDVEQLLAQRGTVFLLGGEEAQVAPLVCAMTAWIAREARRLAALRPGGRLDPPLGLRLDECALICPVPLHQWSADMGGRGVSIVACFQSRAQLIDRYGEAKAATILNNAGAKVLFGGTGDREDLQFWSTLAGERDEPTLTTDLHGRVASRTTRRVPVLAPAQIATLAPGRVVVFTSTMPPIIGRAQRAYRRLDVRAHHHPDQLAVRAQLWATRTATRLGAWAWAHVVPLLVALVGLAVMAPYGAVAAARAGLVPGWLGWLSGASVGILAGLLIGQLAVNAWQAWHRPVAGFFARWQWPRMTRRTRLWSIGGQPSGDTDPITVPLPIITAAPETPDGRWRPSPPPQEPAPGAP